jgi:hypothetical protein
VVCIYKNSFLITVYFKKLKKYYQDKTQIEWGTKFSPFSFDETFEANFSLCSTTTLTDRNHTIAHWKKELRRNDLSK